MWLGDSNYSLAGSLVTLIHQLVLAYPDREWQTSGGTGTIGDAAHRAEGSASDHNPWKNNTVRALDVAKTVNGPDCEQLFRMVNKMYGDRDPRVFPYGYAIFNGRITDWDNPGGFHAQVGDQHTEHVHISVGQSGYNSTAPWPLPTTDWLDTVDEKTLRTIIQEECTKAVDRRFLSHGGNKPHGVPAYIEAYLMGQALYEDPTGTSKIKTLHVDLRKKP